MINYPTFTIKITKYINFHSLTHSIRCDYFPYFIGFLATSEFDEKPPKTPNFIKNSHQTCMNKGFSESCTFLQLKWYCIIVGNCLKVA